MAREFAKAFYHSKAWLSFRQSYINSMPKDRRGLCEKCYEEGRHEIGVELHHKVFLTPDNINNPNVTLNKDKVILLCKDCHRKIHQRRKNVLYEFNELGEYVPVVKETPPIPKK